MLDLNVDIITTATESNYEEKARALEAEKLREDSGTSDSSVVNAEEDSYSNNTSPFIFDILKKDKHGLCNNNREDQIVPSPEFSTRSLFPEKGDGGGGGGGGEFGVGLASSNTTSRPQWLNLSFAESCGQAELKAVQQKTQQARKSRRGPRSRSSQYRGVTFYRRTGRWESHIWSVFAKEKKTKYCHMQLLYARISVDHVVLISCLNGLLILFNVFCFWCIGIVGSKFI